MPRRALYPKRRSSGVVLPPELWDALQDAAYARNISRNLLITLWLTERLEVEQHEFTAKVTA